VEENISISAGAGTASGTRVELSRLLTHLKRSAFVRNILVVMTGTAIAQAIGFALSPVVSRLFSPSDFGVFGAFSAAVSIMSTLTTLQYSGAIILPKKNSDAVNLLALSCLSTLVLTALCGIACLVAPTALKALMRTSGGWALVLFVCGTLASGLNLSFQSWCVRAKAFKGTSASQVIRSLSSNGLQLGGGCLNTGAPGLMVSTVLAEVAATLNLGRVVFRDWRTLQHRVRWQRIRRLAFEYRDFPLYSASTSLLNALSLGLPIFLLTHFYGLAVAGAYAFAIRVLSAPMGFILTALKQVLLQKAAEAHNDGRRLIGLYAKITLGLFAVALLPSLFLLAWAPPLFSWLFGAQWLQAGKFASSLVIWLLFLFSNAPALLFGRIIRIQRQMFLFDVAVLLLRSATLWFGGMYLSPASTILVFSSVGGIMNVFFMGLVGYQLWKSEAGKCANSPAGALT
jgi:lipopolysaccharide exporter